jgi:hypothetical protein
MESFEEILKKIEDRISAGGCRCEEVSVTEKTNSSGSFTVVRLVIRNGEVPATKD